MLGDLELEQVQVVTTDEDQVVVRHPVPALEGDFLQDLGRRGARLTLTGVLTRPDVHTGLAALREQFHAGDPVPFVSDISTATLVDQVVVERMDVREVAGRPSAYEYALTLRELTEAEPVTVEPVIIPPPPPPPVEQAQLSVTVVVEGDPAFDMDRVHVSVRGTQDEDALPLDRVLTNRIRPDTWFEDPFPAGSYTAEALVDDTATPTGQREVLSGSAPVRVVDGAVTSVTIVLRRGAKVGTVLVITFHFDKAFVEPCERHVLARVVERARAHADERLLIVGHTDKVGSDAYNQALSERRGRATYAMLTFGSDPARSVAEWDELRRTRPTGTTDTVKDSWGTREVQHMLQDLGRFRGNVGKDLADTDAAVRQFQRDHGLVDDGVVGDATWPVLIEEYLAHDALDLPVDRLMRNADAAGCDNGPLRWLGCGEDDPVLNVLTAWRPNRRTELLFVHEQTMPVAVPAPVTLAQVPAGAGGGGWCLDDGTATTRDGFVVPWDQPCPSNAPGTTGPAPASQPWCRTPAEPGSFVVAGTITFEDGSPYASGPYVLMAADGEYLDGEVPATAAGVHAGEPVAGRTQPDGSFTYPQQKGPGVYVLAVDGPFLARTRTQTLADVRGNAVCLRLDGSAPVDVVIVDRAVASVQPSITGPEVVVVKKPHTNPARRPVVLRASTAFTGSGTLTRSSDVVRLFDAAAGGTELTFDGVDNVFTAAQLTAGVTLFTEGRAASAAVGDVTLTLRLTVGATPGLSATHTLTCVALTLDLHASRTAVGVDPVPLSEAAKITPGRFVQVQDAGTHAGRALLTVRAAQPAAFTGTLRLAALDARTRLFAAADEVAAPGQAVVPFPVLTPNAAVPADGLRFWVEGAAVSGALRDATLQLGIDTVEADGDHVQLTVVELRDLTMTIPGTAPRTARLGNGPVPPHVVPAAPAAPVPADLDTNPRVNPPVPLLEGSVVVADPIALRVTVRPVGAPVRWSVLRAAGIPAADGGDDAPAIVALHAAPAPTLVEDAADALRATLLTDGTGTYHVRAFLDGNGNGRYDQGVDREPAIVRNVVLGRATLFLDSTVASSANFVVTPLAGNGFDVRSGQFDIANPGTAAVHLNAQVDLVTGGTDGRRSADRYFGSWTNDLLSPTTFSPTFTDPTTAPPTVHPAPFVFASNRAAATGPGGEFIPGDPAPALVVPPVLDTGRPGGGSGGETSSLTRSRIRSRTPLPIGQRWIVEAVDSPGVGITNPHPAVAAARLTAFTLRIRFDATLTLWTNATAVAGATGDPADRLYGALERVDWQLDGRWTIDPGTGAIAVVSAPASAVTARVPSTPAVTATASGVEVRPPTGLNTLVQDARA
ncbi:peptidoglycan-binding protein [Cellulomonas soli]|nr:peptidoglycan-binding protein [Cellulomonas soli]NYI59201.1 outer membrane protein OmpA-like peptidoglycan-associated protein [Cellulomonas soli]